MTADSPALAHDVSQMTAGPYPDESGHLEPYMDGSALRFAKKGTGFSLPGCRRTTVVSSKAITGTIPATIIRWSFVLRACLSGDCAANVSERKLEL